jgi:ParB/RepB/Spo0J family partition protein
MPSKKAVPLPLGGWEDIIPTAPGVELDNARELPVALIEINPRQSRQHFDEESLAELQTSIEQHGVLEPILVRTVEDPAKPYVIVAGERRFRAAVAAGLTAIPALIHAELSEADAAFLTALENLQREDLDLEDEARQFAYLLKLTGLSQRELARQLGVGFNYISERVRLLDRPDLIAAYRAGTLTLREAMRQIRDERAGAPAGGVYSGNTAADRPADQESVYSGNTDPAASSAAAGVLGRNPDQDVAAKDVYSGNTAPDRERVHRDELPDPASTALTMAAFKPADRFARYVARIQPADVPPPQRLALADRLEAAAREAQLAARALRAAGENPA